MRHLLRFVSLVFLVALVWLLREMLSPAPPPPLQASELAFAYRKLEKHYGKEIDSLCQAEGVLPAYFKALIILESSANKPAISRFEENVFRQLSAVRDGSAAQYGFVKPEHLRGTSDEYLKQLASSWGPVQIMGYHTLWMQVPVSELYGEQALKHAIGWCRYNYGHYLKEGKFSDAFHFHNTGKPYPRWWKKPRTYDPLYVKKGLQYLHYFDTIGLQAISQKPLVVSKKISTVR